MNKMSIDTSNAVSIINALIEIIEKGTEYYTIETYNIDLSAYFEEPMEFEGEKDKEIICPHVNNKRLWRRLSAKCRTKTEYKPCHRNCKDDYRSFSCSKYFRECLKGLGKKKPDCDNCKLPMIERCGSYDNGKCEGLMYNPDCNPKGCKEYQKALERYLTCQDTFRNGLHLFEVKSNGDSFSRLSHQLPGLIPFCDYLWFVLGEKHKVPEWVPPWMGVIIATKKGLKFKQYAERLGTRVNSTGVYHPKRVFEVKGTETLPELYRKLTIQAIFGWKFKDIDVAEDALRKAFTDYKSDKILINRMLDEFEGDQDGESK